MIFKTIQQIDENGIITNQKVVSWLQARKIAQDDLSVSLIKESISLETDEFALRSLENAIANGIPYQQAFNTYMQKASITAKEYAVQTQGLAGSTDIYVAKQKKAQAQLKANTATTKAATVATKALSMAMNMVVVTLIIKGIQLVTDAVEKYINRVKYAEEAMEEAQGAIVSSQKRLKEVSDTINENKDRFLKLSEGVDEFSKNLELSEDEYAEYLSMCNEFAEISPSLVYGYDEQGNALLNIGKNAEETAVKLNEVLEAEKILAEQELVKNKGTLAESIYTQVKDAYDAINALEMQLNDYKTRTPISFTEDAITSSTDSSLFIINERQLISQLGTEKTDTLIKMLSSSVNSFNYDADWEQITFSSEDLEIAKKTIEDFYKSLGYYNKNEAKAYINGINQDIEKQNQTIKSLFSQYNSTLLAWVKSTYEYDFLTQQQQTFIDALIPSIDWKSISDETGKIFVSDKKYEEYIKDNYIVPLMSIPDEYESKINQKFSELLQFESGSIEAYNFVKDLQSELKDIGIVIDFKFLIGDGEEVANNLNSLKDSIARDIVGVEVGESMNEGQKQYYNNLTYKIDQFAKEYSINTQDEIAAFNDAYEKANGDIDKAFEYYLQQLESKQPSKLSFSEVFNSSDFSEQKEELLELAKAGELTPETLSSTEEYVTLLKQTGLSAESAKDKIYNLLSAQERLAGAHNGLDDLSNSYEEFKELNFVTAQTLEELPDVFKSLEGYDLFAKIVGNPESGVEAIQNAFNDIVKEYLIFTQTLNVNDLISDDFETQQRAINTYIANLKQMGVTNAEKVVNQTVESLKQSEDLVNKAEAEYNKYLMRKNEADLKYIESSASYNSQLVNSMGSAYKTDYDNWIDSLTAKKDAYNAFLVALKMADNSWANSSGKNTVSYATLVNKVLKGEYLNEGYLKSLQLDSSTVSNIMAAQSQYLMSSQDSEQLKNDLKANYSFNSSDYALNYNGSDTNNNSNSDSDTYFDWIETKLDKLNDQLDETKEKAEDTFNGWKIRADAFTEAKNQIESLIATQEEAKARYEKEANKSGLPDKYKLFVQDGAIDIDKLSNDDPLKEQIESYQKWYDKVKECDEAIAELEVDLKQLYRDKREFRWEVFDYLEDSISRITDEADYLIELLSNENLFNDKGHLTKYADATLGLHFSSYDAYIQKAKDYEEEIKDLEGQLATGGQKVLDKYNERVDAHQEAINAAKNERDAILDLVENSYQKQLDYLNKIIDKKKESLNAEKD